MEVGSEVIVVIFLEGYAVTAETKKLVRMIDRIVDKEESEQRGWPWSSWNPVTRRG